MRLPVISVFAFVLVLTGAVGCGGEPPAALDAAVRDLSYVDIPAWPASVAGRWATEFTLSIGAAPVDAGASDGGAPDPLLKFLAIFSGIQRPTGEVDTAWTLCAFHYPQLGDITDDALDPWMATSKLGHIDGPTDGAIWTQPPLAIVVGAQLADPVADPLPTSAAKLCADATATGCVVSDGVTGRPGIAVSATGLSPDADVLYVDLRVGYAFSATYEHLGVLHGDVKSAQVEAHVLGCHLRGGADCSAEDVAAIERSRPSIKVSGGSLRWRAQGAYFTCPSFEMDPEGSLVGDGVPMDGGVIDMAGPMRMSFSEVISHDIDSMGCATIGCHESFTRAGAMKLHFRPKTAALLRQNYEAVLPWTKTDGIEGGRFANEVPIPGAMKQRWIDWINAGAPF